MQPPAHAAPHFAFWPSDMPRNLPPAEATLHATFESAARRYPGKTLLYFEDSALDYRAALDQMEALAGYLQAACGVRRGDRVLVDLQNSAHFVIALYAVLRADAVVVPVSPANLAGELAHYLEDSGAKVAIAAGDIAGRFASLPLEHLLVAGSAGWDAALAAGHAPAASRSLPGDLCMMPYTSGSTGQPKGCMHTHASVHHNVLGSILWKHVTDATVALATAPFFHVTGLIHSLMATAHAGGTIVIQPRWDPVRAAELVERHRCTHWDSVPTMPIDLLSSPEAMRRDISSLKWLFGGGAAMPEAIAQRLREVCGVDYIEGYGLTETISQTHMNPPQRAKKQCLGIPAFDTEACVVDPQTLAVLPPGEPGEIVVRGPQLLSGYWHNAKADRESWVAIGGPGEGRRFFRTGDLGRMDADGYYFISDRLKRMINSAGLKVWPAEVEAAMYHHPAIRECCIIASPDARKGELVKAVVVLKAQGAATTGAEIIEWMRTQMAAYKVPRAIEFIDALPRTPSGKIQWRALQDREFAPMRGHATSRSDLTDPQA
ncbi:MAG: AMP-binding protein [Betaproteobacteria bacterium]